MSSRTKVAPRIEEQAYIMLQLAAEAHMRPAAELLKGHGLSPTQYNVLRILRGAGEEGLTCTQISERMINRDPDITRLLDRMEARDWVTRERQTRDRRVILARISATGLALVNALDEPIRELHKQRLGQLGQAKLKAFVKMLEEARLTAVS